MTHTAFDQGTHVLRGKQSQFDLVFYRLTTIKQVDTEKSQTSHFADMVSQNGLILRASDLPLEPRLRLAIVGDLQRSRTVANLRQIGHGVSDGDGSVDPAVASVDVQLRLAGSSECEL